VLQENAKDTLTAFRGVYVSKEELSLVELTKLANLLYCNCWPDLYVPPEKYVREHFQEDDTDDEAVLEKRARHLTFKHFFIGRDKNARLIDRLFNYKTSEKPISYCDEMFHVEAINLGRNMIHHGARYVKVRTLASYW
jgi:hypothetical protein